MPRLGLSLLFLCLLLTATLVSGCGSTIAVGVSSDESSLVTDDNPQTLTDYDLNPPGTPGAAAPAW